MVSFIVGGIENTIFTIPRTRYINSIEKHYTSSVKGYEDIHKKDISRLKKAISLIDGRYNDNALRVLSGKEAHMKNMFIMSGENFGEYCEWLFSVIDTVVSMSSDRSDQTRYAGALSEFCLDIWAKTNGMNISELQLLETERQMYISRMKSYFERKIFQVR